MENLRSSRLIQAQLPKLELGSARLENLRLVPPLGGIGDEN